MPNQADNKEMTTLARRPGPLAWFARNHVAANIIMLILMVGGVISILESRMEVFPKMDTGLITISVPYLGASPSDVETGVLEPIEEAIGGIEGIKRIRAAGQEGVGTVFAELEDYADRRKALNDIESAVDRIRTFPKDIEDPVVSEVTNAVQVLSIMVSGDVPERTLKNIADQIRDDLTAMDNISDVQLSGIRAYEVTIDVDEQTLRKYNLTFDQIAKIINNASLDLPAGSIRTKGGEILVRTKGQRYTGTEFQDIIIRTNPDGTLLRLSDIANVRDDFEDTDVAAYFDGKTAVTIKIVRNGDQDALDIAATVKKYVVDKRPHMPEGVSLDTWFDRSEYLRGRINLLSRNAIIGLTLVFACLLAFLDFRLAFWTTLGIPVCFLGAFWLMPMFDVTINMISLFALIVVLGIVVDDAIVIGENIYRHKQNGLSDLDAAVAGVREMAGPVFVAILTTVVAFLPLMFTAGQMGKILYVFPIVVIAVLLISLIEALVILPAHLSQPAKFPSINWLRKFQRRTQNGLNWLIRQTYVPTLRWIIKYRYLSASAAFTILIVILALVFGGHVRQVFFEDMDADNVLVSLKMPQGTPVSETRKVVTLIEQAAARLQARLETDRPEGALPIFKHLNTNIGDQPFLALIQGQEMDGRTSVVAGAGHIAEINIELVSGEFREIPGKKIANMLREEVGEIPGVSSLTFQASFFSPGESVNVEFAHHDWSALQQATNELKEKLRDYNGVSQIDDSFEPGKRELKVALTDAGRTLGLTLNDLSKQVRGAFYGSEAQRIQRNRDEVRIMVRFPESQRKSLHDIENMQISLNDDTKVPFQNIATYTIGPGYSQINRVNKKRVISVTADVDETIISADNVNEDLRSIVLPAIRQKYPGLTTKFEGEQKQQRESFASLQNNYVFALFGIFALLAMQFKSYIQPLIVMSAIPFGFIGAVIGHVILGMPLSFLSFFGVVALTGIVVNDSLIMIDLINRLQSQRLPLSEILIQSGVQRFRPILLTTATTFCGLTPMLLERSLQAKFLVPMAVSLAFGVAFATFITLVLVPILYAILEDIRTHLPFTQSYKNLHDAADTK